MYRRRCKLGSFTVLTMTDMVQEIGVLKNIATVVGFPLTSSEKRECLWFWLTLLVEDERPDSYRIAVFSAHTSKIDQTSMKTPEENRTTFNFVTEL